jgi:hypothetical protein
MLGTLAFSVLCWVMAIENECLKVCFCGVSVIIGPNTSAEASLAQFSVSKGGFGFFTSVLGSDGSLCWSIFIFGADAF